MQYNDLVKSTASDLVLKLSNHLSDVSPSSSKGAKIANNKDKGAFAFDLSELSEKDKFHVLSLAEETLKFSYTFKYKGKDAKIIYYERNLWGISVSFVKLVLVLGLFLAVLLLLTFLYFLVQWFIP
jgi:hypothetical protein